MRKIARILFLTAIICSLIMPACNSPKGTKKVSLTLICNSDATEANISQATEIIKKRLIKYGLNESDIKINIDGKNISIEANQVDNSDRVVSLCSVTGEIGFWETYELSDIFSYLDDANKKLAVLLKNSDTTATGKTIKKANATSKVVEDNSSLIGKVKNDKKNDKAFEEYAVDNPLFARLAPNTTLKEDGTYTLGEGPVVGYCNVSDTAEVNSFLAMDEIKLLFPLDIKFLWEAKCEDLKNSMLRLIAIKVSSRDGKPAIDKSMITETDYQQGQSGSYEVLLTMNNEGANIWKRFTQANIGKRIAIVIDDYVYSYPKVMDQISNGKSLISGNFSQEEAQDLAIIIKLNALPVSFSVSDIKVSE